MYVLVTGGLGYIGSHTVVELIQNGKKVIILDNLSNSELSNLDNLKKLTDECIIFEKCDIRDETKLHSIFEKFEIDSVIHFAGLKYVEESFIKPIEYIDVNINGTINIIEVCKKFEIKNLVFSSSATVYGKSNPPLKENIDIVKPLNPYGYSKYICEELLRMSHKELTNTVITILRYFNPIGAHKSGLIGEKITEYSSNIMPNILLVADDKKDSLTINGKNYDTKDGTTIRDFIHVMDLANAHAKALNIKIPGLNIFNVGTGSGYTLLELLQTFQDVNEKKLNINFGENREGDIVSSFADSSKIKAELQWNPIYSLEDMCKDSWNYYKSTYRGQ
ncbi:UDP-glucose 4-epimerase GalE [Macrococcus armenti]|uniref:UDP-glucose 4-epimerase GalE n=1 Tax=Macrococcus armenti TaxID=2875764 RepID=UPI001CD32882|nr:UDP-glucose 4-epimerase GalE [Macrococcus armenti]UBH11662.1 UDP-glucose 4-epimerase GalE [Macrococcus armenti]